MTKAELLERLEAELHSGSPDERPGLCRRLYTPKIDGPSLIEECLQAEAEMAARGVIFGPNRYGKTGARLRAVRSA